MNNYFTSLVRTWVPIGIGAVISYLAAKGIVLGEDAADGAVTFVTAVCMGVYYAIVRYVELKAPQFGWLLGLAKTPGYAAGDPPAPSPGPLPDLGDPEE